MKPEKKTRITFSLTQKEIAQIIEMLGLTGGGKLAYAIRAFLLKPRKRKSIVVTVDFLHVGEAIDILSFIQNEMNVKELLKEDLDNLIYQAKHLLTNSLRNDSKS